MGYYKNPERFIHSGSDKLEDLDLNLIDSGLHKINNNEMEEQYGRAI